MKNIIPILILSLLPGSGCITKKACERKFPPSADSVRIVSNTITTYRDTIVYAKVKGDTVFRTITLSGSPVVSQVQTPLANCTVSVRDGKLSQRLEQKDTLLDLTIKDAQKTTITSNSKNRIATRIQKVNELTHWQWVQIWMGRIFGIGIIALIFWKGIRLSFF